MDFGTTPATIKSVNGAGTQVTVTSPTHLTGTVDVTVTARGDTSSTSSADRFTYLGPVITSLSATAGPTVGGAKLKIHGTGLSGATSVTFGSTPATGLKANKAGTLITVVVPANAPGGVHRDRHHTGWHRRGDGRRPLHLRGPVRHLRLAGLRPGCRRHEGHDRRDLPEGGRRGLLRYDPRLVLHRERRGTSIKVDAPAGTGGTVTSP